MKKEATSKFKWLKKERPLTKKEATSKREGLKKERHPINKEGTPERKGLGTKENCTKAIPYTKN
jgi:hypothetical protein